MLRRIFNRETISNAVASAFSIALCVFTFWAAMQFIASHRYWRVGAESLAFALSAASLSIGVRGIILGVRLSNQSKGRNEH